MLLETDLFEKFLLYNNFNIFLEREREKEEKVFIANFSFSLIFLVFLKFFIVNLLFNFFIKIKVLKKEALLYLANFFIEIFFINFNILGFYNSFYYTSS